MCADILAVDHHGRGALHHLLESKDTVSYAYRPPKIGQSLAYLLEHYPALINQPDNNGNYPLHSALQRLRRYALRHEWDEDAELDTLIDELLEAGADPHVRDSRGNSALHYVADEGLAETLMGEQTRHRFRMFLDRGVDIRARNQAGQSALELLLDDDGKRAAFREGHYSIHVNRGRIPLPTSEEVDEDVFGLFQKAGVRWTDRDREGRTPLHIIAGYPGNSRGPAWAKRLLSKGIDPQAKDCQGKTAIDVASACANQAVLNVLKSNSKESYCK